MYGNNVLPAFNIGTGYKVPKGSIWRGYPEATWFKVVQVSGDDETATTLAIGTIMKECADGTWTAISESDIITTEANLPGLRLGIVADDTAETGYTYTPDGASDPITVKNGILVGVAGQVDKSKLLIGNKTLEDLTDAQKLALQRQLGAWNIDTVFVFQA